MKKTLNEPYSLANLIWKSLRYHARVMISLFPVIMVFVLVKNILLLIGQKIQYWPINELIYMVIILTGIFLYFISLYQTNKILLHQPISLVKSVRIVIAGCLKIYLAIFFMFFVAIVIVYGTRLLVFSVFQISNSIIIFFILLVVGFLVMGLLLKWYFAVPLLIENCGLISYQQPLSLFSAFKTSYDLVGTNWQEVLLVYALMLTIVILIIPHPSHGHWWQKFYGKPVVDFIVLVVLLPLLTNLSWLILNNLRIAAQVDMKKL